MKQNLNEQIARIKQLLVIKEASVVKETETILNEQLFAQLMKQMGISFERKFIPSIEAKLGKKFTTATDKEIGTTLNSLPVLRQEIAAAVYTAEKSIIDGVFSKYDMSIAGEAAAAYNELQIIKTTAYPLGLPKSILRDVASEWKIAGKGNTTKTTGSNPLTQSTPPPNTPSTGLNLNPNASIREAMDASIAETAKKNPDALSYYAQIETFGFSDAVERSMKYQYSKIGNKPASELILEARMLSKQLDYKRFGWLLNIGEKIAQNPTKAITNTGKTGIAGIAYYTLIALAISASTIVLAYKTKIMDWFGKGGSNTNNSGAEQEKKGKYD